MPNTIIAEGKTTTEAIANGLKELNVSLKDIDWLANAAYNDICLGGNSKEASVEDIKKIYERIYEGI